MNYILKYKRPTKKEHGHTDIFDQTGSYIGYMIPNRSQYSAVGENWYLNSFRLNIYKSFISRKELLNFLNGLIEII